MLLLPVIFLSTYSAFAAAAYQRPAVKSISLDDCTEAIIHWDTKYTRGQPLMGKLPRSADNLMQCLKQCMTYGNGNKCKAVNFQRPNCVYLDSGVADDLQARRFKATGHVHAVLTRNCPSASSEGNIKSMVATLLQPCVSLEFENIKFNSKSPEKDDLMAPDVKKCAQSCRDYGRGNAKDCNSINYHYPYCNFLNSSIADDPGNAVPSDAYTHAFIKC